MDSECSLLEYFGPFCLSGGVPCGEDSGLLGSSGFDCISLDSLEYSLLLVDSSKDPPIPT